MPANARGPSSPTALKWILVWRPRGSDGTFWRVRSTRKGLEGWLAGGQLTEHTVCRPSPPLSLLGQPRVPRRCERRSPGHRGGTDRPTVALLYKTLHDALGFRIKTVDIAIGKPHPVIRWPT
jgi:hypothetical protein